ncbi:hypothetical protein N431DRAFT_442414 [Stipitochalara longipes BDJ]|nr:hypothetical protein N431DRAFT_442414 [Stipitochalara longipes BDJ]
MADESYYIPITSNPPSLREPGPARQHRTTPHRKYMGLDEQGVVGGNVCGGRQGTKSQTGGETSGRRGGKGWDGEKEAGILGWEEGKVVEGGRRRYEAGVVETDQRNEAVINIGGRFKARGA